MIDSKGKMFVEDNDIIELMLANRQAKILPRNTENFRVFENQCKAYGFDMPFTMADNGDQFDWAMPEEFKKLNLRDFILNKHKLNFDQIQRVDQELKEFEQRNLIELLRFLCYFVEMLKSNNIIYGVGRGSSIASYVLYLIGIHRIDSFKYNIDIKEFLK